MSATAAQISYLSALVFIHAVAPDEYVTLAMAASGQASASQVSRAIDSAKKAPVCLPKKTVSAEPGYYLLRGVVHVVVRSKDSDRLYAKRLLLTPTASGASSARWAYIPGVIFECTPDRRLTADQAREMGRLHGVCMVCGRTLTDPKSAEQGIGPVCIKKLG